MLLLRISWPSGFATARVLILEPQSVKPLLAVLCDRVLIYARRRIDLLSSGVGRRRQSYGHGRAVPSGLLGKAVPFILAFCFNLIGVVLRLGVFVGALIEELGVDLHEKLHGVVDHAMDCSTEGQYTAPCYVSRVLAYSSALSSSRIVGRTL